jgi:predicted DNA-binding protein (UPF0251 family)
MHTINYVIVHKIYKSSPTHQTTGKTNVRGRHRCGNRGRHPKPVTLTNTPPHQLHPNPPRNPNPITIEVAELEAFRLVDMDGLSQEEAGKKMNISRGTIWRLVQSARRKAAQALSEGRPIQVTPSNPNENP